jgi:hypothetical protein
MFARLALGLTAAALGAAGCGDDEENRNARTAERPPATAEKTQPKGHGGDPAPPPRTGGTSPEDQPGGAGDEEPARAPALFTARGGRITPRVVHVAPYIAIRVELRLRGGGRHALRFGETTMRVGGDIKAAFAEFEGLRPGRSLRGVTPDGEVVRVVADAEPGP